jgi:hypothetical protein
MKNMNTGGGVMSVSEPSRELEVYDSDFYEEDEPIEDIMAILEDGFDGVTTPPDEAADDLVTVDPSPWLLGQTSRRYVGRSPVVRHQSTGFVFRLSGAASP